MTNIADSVPIPPPPRGCLFCTTVSTFSTFNVTWIIEAKDFGSCQCCWIFWRMERLSSISSLKYRAGRSIHSTVQYGKCYTECCSVALSKEGGILALMQDLHVYMHALDSLIPLAFDGCGWSLCCDEVMCGPHKHKWVRPLALVRLSPSFPPRQYICNSGIAQGLLAPCGAVWIGEN